MLVLVLPLFKPIIWLWWQIPNWMNTTHTVIAVVWSNRFATAQLLLQDWIISGFAPGLWIESPILFLVVQASSISDFVVVSFTQWVEWVTEPKTKRGVSVPLSLSACFWPYRLFRWKVTFGVHKNLEINLGGRITDLGISSKTRFLCLPFRDYSWQIEKITSWPWGSVIDGLRVT